MQSINDSSETVYRFDSFELNSARRILLRDGEVIPLTSKRFEILLVLVRNSGRVLDKDELMKAVWPDTIVEETNLAHNISALRKALGEKAGEHRFIATVPGQGYRFVASLIEEQNGSDETILVERTYSRFVYEEDSTAEATTGPTAPQIETTASRNKLQRLIKISAAAIIATLATIALYLLINRGGSSNRFSNVEMSRITTAGSATSAIISPDGKYLGYVIEDSQGQSLWIRHVSTSSSVCIAPAAQVQYWGITFSPDGDYVYYCTFDSTKPHENLYRVPILGGPPALLPVETNTPITFSPDGQQFAYVLPARGEETHLLIASADGSEKKILARRVAPDFFLSFPAGPSWSPDGKTIACSYATTGADGLYSRLIGVRVEDGKQFPITDEKWNYIGQAAWMTDGSGLVFIAVDNPGSPNQVWHYSPESGQARRITNDLNDYRGVSLSGDADSLVTVQRHVASSLWVAPADDPDAATQIASETGALSQIKFTSDEKIIYGSSASGKHALWSIEPDGSGARQVPTVDLSELGFSVSPDGRYIVYASARAGTLNLWKLDTQSGDLKQLTSGSAENRPQFTPDGKWIIYERGFGNVTRTLWKIAAGGGEPVQLTASSVMRPALSPDGKSIAYYFIDKSRANSPWCIGIISSDGGAMLKKFDIPPTVTSRFVGWTANGQAIAYINDVGSVSNIWVQPLNGNPPQQITRFQSGRILAFNWSPGGKRLAFSRAVESSYIALMTHTGD